MHGGAIIIRKNEFNSAWWGADVGIITDPDFFTASLSEQLRRLGSFAWVEYRQLYDHPFPARELTAAGFTHADVQVRFRLGLRQIKPTSRLDCMKCSFADEIPFVIDPLDMSSFQHERFAIIPGITSERINERYCRWANDHLRDCPEWCLEVRMQDRPQGWFISRMDGKLLNLTLAMLHTDATISGMDLYQKAMVAYSDRGARIGTASFSVTNTNVMGIYAKLGARYLTPEGFWLWVNPSQ